MTAAEPSTENRRPLKTRGTAWAGALAKRLAAAKISPDNLSGCSVVVAIFGGALLCASGAMEPAPRGIVLVVAAACIQLRLLCNMLDGMVAVEFNRGSAYGPLWNELPDRFADVFFLAGAGYGAGHLAGPALGWICAVLAVMTAYIRELGRGLGLPADFSGPMAKPHRMAALTVTCLVSAIEPLWLWNGQAIVIGLAIIALGAFVTVVRRTSHLATGLRARSGEPLD
jgi:phosphatidylglycerophosphate synthase